jgi:outer membrane receptor protein involved in Fe transport
MFMRSDFMTDRVEVVRGGSASTLASNAPGAIVNFIGKNSKDAGNSVGYTAGIGNRLNRIDYAFTSALSPDTHINLGGFQRQSDGGPTSTNYNAADGGQIRAAITKELDNGGYVRVNFKALNDKTPSYMPVPVTISNGAVTTFGNYDPRKTSVVMVGTGFNRDVTMDKDGNKVASNPQDGTVVSSNAIGLEGKFNVGSGWTVEEKFRKSSNSGRFNAPLGLNLGAGDLRNVQLSTSLDNMDAMFNDIKASKAFDLSGGKSVFTAGLFSGSQRVAQTWGFNQYVLSLSDPGNYTAQIQNGIGGGNLLDNPRTFDVTYRTTAPYAVLNWDKGPLNLDASVRNNNFTAAGATYRPNKDINGNYVMTGWDPASKDIVNYSINRNSYSLGGNYTLNKDLSVYGRLSDGFAMPNERNLYGTVGALNGIAPGVNEVKQQEVGVKYRSGSFSMFATYFQAQTEETNYEVTTNLTTANSYDAKGVELEVGYKSGGFRVAGGMTYSDAKIVKTKDGTNVGNRPKNQAPLMFQVTPSYSFGRAEVGVAVIGTTDSYFAEDNAVKMPGYVVTNLFSNYKVDKRTTLTFAVANLFDQLAYTEGNVGAGFARSIPGRTARASIRYDF